MAALIAEREALYRKIRSLPDDAVLRVMKFIETEAALYDRVDINDITLASERSLAKDWLLPEEDDAWANL